VQTLKPRGASVREQTTRGEVGKAHGKNAGRTEPRFTSSRGPNKKETGMGGTTRCSRMMPGTSGAKKGVKRKNEGFQNVKLRKWTAAKRFAPAGNTPSNSMRKEKFDEVVKGLGTAKTWKAARKSAVQERGTGRKRKKPGGEKKKVVQLSPDTASQWHERRGK